MFVKNISQSIYSRSPIVRHRPQASTVIPTRRQYGLGQKYIGNKIYCIYWTCLRALKGAKNTSVKGVYKTTLDSQSFLLYLFMNNHSNLDVVLKSTYVSTQYILWLIFFINTSIYFLMYLTKTCCVKLSFIITKVGTYIAVCEYVK